MLEKNLQCPPVSDPKWFWEGNIWQLNMVMATCNIGPQYPFSPTISFLWWWPGYSTDCPPITLPGLLHTPHHAPAQFNLLLSRPDAPRCPSTPMWIFNNLMNIMPRYILIGDSYIRNHKAASIPKFPLAWARMVCLSKIRFTQVQSEV